MRTSGPGGGSGEPRGEGGVARSARRAALCRAGSLSFCSDSCHPAAPLTVRVECVDQADRDAEHGAASRQPGASLAGEALEDTSVGGLLRGVAKWRRHREKKTPETSCSLPGLVSSAAGPSLALAGAAMLRVREAQTPSSACGSLSVNSHRIAAAVGA